MLICAVCITHMHTLSGLGAQFGRRFEVYNILLCTTTQWYNMLKLLCVRVSAVGDTKCTNVDPSAIMRLEIVRNGFGPLNARRAQIQPRAALLYQQIETEIISSVGQCIINPSGRRQ